MVSGAGDTPHGPGLPHLILVITAARVAGWLHKGDPACGCAATRGSGGTRAAHQQDMERRSRPLRTVRRRLGMIAEGAMRLFGRIARRLQYPALVSVPVSAAMLSPVVSVSPEQHLDEVALLFTRSRV